MLKSQKSSMLKMTTRGPPIVLRMFNEQQSA